MLLLLASLIAPASAECTLVALETTVDRSPAEPGVSDVAGLLRTDRWTWRVDEGWPDCGTVDFADLPDVAIRDVQVAIDRPDGRNPKLTGTRVTAVTVAADPSFGAAPGLRVHAPEVQPADLLVVTVTRSWPDEGLFSWWPGARGALEIATLDAPADLPLDAPGKPAVDGARQRVEVTPVAASEPEPFALSAYGEAPPTEQVVALLLPPERPARALAEPGKGATLEARSYTTTTPVVATIPYDRTSALLTTAEPADGRFVGRTAVWVDGEARILWIRPGAPASGVLTGPGYVFAPRAEIAFSGPCAPTDQTLAQVLGGLDQTRTDAVDAAAPLTTAWRCTGPSTWRLTALDGVPVLPDRDAALRAVSWLAMRTAIPEPGLPSFLRKQKGEAAALPDVVDLFHTQVRVVEDSPLVPALAPRKLTKARRSGWVTPWEGALLLSRYLRQLKLDATPYPAVPLDWTMFQPAADPPALLDPAALDVWTGAVVRVDLPGQEPLWIDPGCRTCAPGTLRGRWHHAPLLSDRQDALGDVLPTGGDRWWVVERIGAGEHYRMTLYGAVAVELRHMLGQVAPDQRLPWLRDHVLGPRSRILSHDGITESKDVATVEYTFD